MAQKLDYARPFNDLTQYIPRELRNPVNVGLFDNLFNRFMTRDESVPFYGYVGRRPTSSEDKSPRVPQPSVERDINAIIPVLNFKVGSETYAFTAQDLISKARVLGIDTNDLAWLYSQGNTFAPPINFDKFTNFFNYYWVGQTYNPLPDTPWNPSSFPEYYVIAAPELTDLDKLNVTAATVPGQNIILTGAGFNNHDFVVEFTSPTTFTITPSETLPLQGPSGTYTPVTTTFSLSATPALEAPGDPLPANLVDTFTYSVTGPAGTIQLLTFTITREPFADGSNNHAGFRGFLVGDTFTIETTYLSPNYNVSFTGVGTSVRGGISTVLARNVYQQIDGIALNPGDRVLVKNQSDALQNGIYQVSAGDWNRTTDFDTTTWTAGARVFVRNGTQASTLWESSGVAPLFSWSNTGITVNNSNDWQEGNFWVKGEDLAALGFDSTSVLQATRPIIEYSASLQLNEFVGTDNLPGEGTSNFKQQKTEFNQIPLFDMFRYDGTHTKSVSSIFYYVEDLEADLDIVLQKRVKLADNGSGDYIFNHGCQDANGNVLFFKQDGALRTVWHAGYTGPEVVDFSFAGTGDGTLTAITAAATTQQQVWSIVATSSSTFEVYGSKMPTIPAPYNLATVGAPFDNGEIAFTITVGTTPFVAGDAFTLRIGNVERPRYVFRASDDSIQDLYGGPANDTEKVGAYAVSRTFYNNPYSDSRSEITEGSLYAHFRGILNAQQEGLATNYAFGGNILLWGEQQTLLASLLMQRDLTPMSMIDMAKRQYETALNSLRDIYFQKILDYFSSEKVVTYDGTPASEAETNTLLDWMLEVRSLDEDVRTVLFDTTAAVVGFPSTLPQLGLAELIQPTYVFDLVLGQNVLVHHDGHLSSLFVNDAAFRQELLGFYTGRLIERSDGTSTPAVGSLTNVAPPNPYKGELWVKPAGSNLSTIFAFDVDVDANTLPSVEPPLNFIDVYPVGVVCYVRSLNALYQSSGSGWVPLAAAPSTRWKEVDFAATLNEVIFLTEQRLFNGINPDQRRYDFSPLIGDPVFAGELERELSTFAALNGFDPFATNYNPADAFTWNYSQAATASFAPVAAAAVPARWYNALTSHQATVAGVIPTERPDVEPWKLFGYSSYSAWWSSLSPAMQASYTPAAEPPDLSGGMFVNAGFVKAVKTVSAATPLAGLQVIDGVTLQSGDLVLLQNELAPANNGVWKVSSGTWTRAASLAAGVYVTVTSGTRYSGTTWFLSAAVPTPNVDPVLFEQVRYWTESMWSAIALMHPALKTSVSPWTGNLIPPYVNAGSPLIQYALTTTIPTGVAMPFTFGEGSPVEEVWQRSIEYNYALVKALARFDPLAMLGFAWGFNWVEVDGILYDGMDVNMPGHKRFLLHGDAVPQIDRTGAMTFTSVTGTGPVNVTVTYDAYDANRKQSFSIRDSSGTLLGTTVEGVTATLSLGSVTITDLRIDDLGRPFHIGDSFSIVADASGANLVTGFTPTLVNNILGLGQTFTNALRAVSIDTDNSYAISAFREWDVNMGYRAGGLVATDDLNIFTDAATLSESSYDLLIKKNKIAKDMWLQALRVTVLQYGEFAKTPPSTLGPQYRGTASSAPAGDGSDWVFRVEGYNPRYTSLSYYDLQSVPSGVEFPSTAVIGQLFFRHDIGSVYSFDGSDWNLATTDEIVTFNVLDQTVTDLTWYQPTRVVGTIDTLLPITITGIQNLVNFMFGYAQYTHDQGWRFNTDNEFNIDAETGRHRNWQLDIEKTIDRIYRGIEEGEGHVLNPFVDRVWVQQDTGLLAEFVDSSLFDITGDAGVFDVLGVRFETADVRPLRTNLISSIAATAPMYSVHAQLDDYEHLFIFSNYVDPTAQTDVLYDPFSGSRAVTYKFNGRRQGSYTFRPEFGGHYLVGNEVRQNLQASTDNLAAVYDANAVFENTLTSTHALALLGFNTKDYFNDLDITDKTQFNFWRGLVQAKGTNMSVDAYLNSNRFQQADIDEYWAYKVAEYGDNRQLSYPEMHIQVEDSLQQLTQLQFDAAPGDELTNFTQISRDDETRWFSIDDLDQDAYFKAETVGMYLNPVTIGQVIKLPFIADKLTEAGAPLDPLRFTQINATTLVSNINDTVIINGLGPATPRYNPVKLFNYVDSELIEQIPHWHPATGQHTPTALENINTIGKTDPARYNYSTLVQGNDSYDPLRPWGDNEVGRIWFDTRKLDYVPYYDASIFPNLSERLSRWGGLADYASIDVYEWVKSAVPPEEYAQLAAVEALDADITSTSKASGEVALTNSYVRSREWSIRPIVWSQTGTVFGGHPSFNAAYQPTLFINGTIYSIEFGTFEQLGISTGMSIGAWDPNPNAPMAVSEAVVDSFLKVINFGGTEFPSIGVPTTVGVPSSVFVEFVEHTQQNGTLVFSDPDQGGGPVGVPRLDADSIVVGYDFTISVDVVDADSGDRFTFTIDTLFNTANTLPTQTLTVGDTFAFELTPFGLSVSLVVTTGGVYAGDAIRSAIIAALNTSVSTLDAANVVVVADNRATSDLGSPDTLSNDPNLIMSNNGIGWAAWNIPTQTQLTADGKQPKSIWKPYPGKYASFSPSEEQLANAIENASSPLTLNDGTIIERYATTWTDWEQLEDTVFVESALTTGTITYTHFENVDVLRTTVYKDGVALLSAAYTIVGPTVTVPAVPAGSTVRVIVRAYSPTDEELAFDPDTDDDLTFQQHFKRDYEYVSLQNRDADGSLSTVSYYFWVRNRSVKSDTKKLTVQAVTQQLRTGPPSYLTFQHMRDAATALPYRYDAITISGLSYLVTKNDTFKLRFTRNFTLRADEVDVNGRDLKNVHTEWTLIRSKQKTRIPEVLWTKLVDSMAGQDAAGNAVPALRRVLYDERTGDTTRFGFGPEQILAPSELLRSSVQYTILNTRLTDTNGTDVVPDFISSIDFSLNEEWFSTPANVRQTMTTIWAESKVSQINEIFFAALEDILASNLQLTDIFKTSRLSVYSVRTVVPQVSVPTYD